VRADQRSEAQIRSWFLNHLQPGSYRFVGRVSIDNALVVTDGPTPGLSASPKQWCDRVFRGPQTVVSTPAATSSIRVANSMTYGRRGNNLFEPASVFNKLAAAELVIGTAI
jgi:hypothetical protein